MFIKESFTHQQETQNVSAYQFVKSEKRIVITLGQFEIVDFDV